jgi:hypothetical protein
LDGRLDVLFCLDASQKLNIQKVCFTQMC